MSRRARRNKGKIGTAVALAKSAPEASRVSVSLLRELQENQRQTRERARKKDYVGAVKGAYMGQVRFSAKLATEAARIGAQALVNSSGSTRDARRYASNWPIWRGYAVGNPADGNAGLLQSVLAHLLALRWLYWSRHWTAAGPEFYSDHRLLERLYTGHKGPDIEAEIDGLGERMVAMFGPSAVDPAVVEGQVHALVSAVHASGHPLQGLLFLENDLQRAIHTAWKAFENVLWLNNYLAQLSDERSTAQYLLMRRLSESGHARPNGRARRNTNRPGPFLKPELKSWPVGDIEHAKLAVRYMAMGRGRPQEYLALLSRLAAIWPPEKAQSRPVWEEYRKHRKEIALHIAAAR